MREDMAGGEGRGGETGEGKTRAGAGQGRVTEEGDGHARNSRGAPWQLGRGREGVDQWMAKIRVFFYIAM